MFDFQDLWQISYDWALSHGLTILIVVLVTLIILRIARIVLRKLFASVANRQGGNEARKRVETLESVVGYTVTTAIVIAALMMVLDELGVNIGPALAAVGIVGVAVGFGSQQLVQDIIGGFFILMENQVRVGDVVQIGGRAGVVERVTLRMIVLRDLAGSVHYVRNGQIDVITNMTTDFSFYVFEIGVAYRENTDEVTQIVKDVSSDICSDAEFSSDILEPIEMLGVDQFADSAVIIKARIKTKPISQWRIGREFNRRLKFAFDKHGIEMPFPHMTVYMGSDKNGASPPLRVVKEG
ncbi:MAG: mechanosensitive ion channel family protein [candidate division Zixibacteria bacterium]